jgi:hypothetical protein
MNTDTFHALLDILEEKVDFDYVESEGADTTRFDMGDNSMWIYQSGEIEGLASMPKKVQNAVNKAYKDLDITMPV